MMPFAPPPEPAGVDEVAATLQDDTGGRWQQAISSACNERIAAFQRPLAGATPPEPRNLKKTMKQRQQPTEPSANELRAMWGAGGRR